MAPGEPSDRRTWSGASHHLFAALERRDALATAVDGTPPARTDTLFKALAVSPRRQRWVERYEYSQPRRWLRSRVASRRVQAVAPDRYVLLQIGAWADVARRAVPRPKLRCSYHDSNLALFRRHGTFIEKADAAHIEREMAAERQLLDGLDLIFAMSDWLRHSFIEDFGQAPEKVVAVGSGVNAKQIPDEVPDRDFSVPRILFVGYDFELKGGPTVLGAFRKLRAQFEDAELWIVGPAPRETGEPGVHWFGSINRDTPEGEAEIQKLHAEANLYAMPSHYDAFPNAFLEAMAYGLPCIGSTACTMPEIISDRVTGRLIAPGDIRALAGRSLELFSNPERAREMGLAGRERVLQRFTWDQVTRRMLDAIGASLGHRDTRLPAGRPSRLAEAAR